MQRVFWIVTLFFALSITALAQEPVEEKADVRLDQKITYQAKGKLLHDVLSDLTELSGVEMTCGSSAKDWQVRDRKLNIFVKDITLEKLQKSIAEVLHFTWARGVTGGEYRYRLFQDLRSKKEEQALLEQELSKNEAKEYAAREGAISGIGQVGAMSAEDLEAIKESDPFLYVLGKTGIASGLSEMMNSSPEVASAFLHGQDYLADFAQMPPSFTAGAAKLIQGMQTMMRTFAPWETDDNDGLLDNLGTARLTLKMNTEQMQMIPEAGIYLGVLIIDANGQSPAAMPLIDPDSPLSKLGGKILVRALDGEPLELVVNSLMPEIETTVKEMQGERVHLKVLPDDPDFEKQVKLETENPTKLQDALEELFKVAELQIISDHFVHTSQIFKSEGKLGDVLKSLSNAFDKIPTKVDDTITFTDREWYLKRSYEVPEDWLKAWRAAADEGRLTIDDKANIASLTDNQIRGIIMNEDDDNFRLGRSTTVVSLRKNILRFYATLSATQKRALKSENGLSVKGLSNVQWSHLELALADHDMISTPYTSITPTTVYYVASGGLEEIVVEGVSDIDGEIESMSIIVTADPDDEFIFDELDMDDDEY